MICYASVTRTRSNLAALRGAGWRILITPQNPKPPAGFAYAIDNGAWPAFTNNLPFDGEAFTRLVDAHGAAADFVVIPDKVAAGEESLAFSRLWLPELKNLKRLLLPVQDGMTATDVGAVLRHNPGIGLFLGGSTEWKLKTMYGWGMVAHAFSCWYHVARVNTAKRIRLAAEAGATSIDGTSATMYHSTLPLLDDARRQPSLLTPKNTEFAEVRL